MPPRPENAISRWSASYARHRTLPVLLGLSVNLGIFASIFFGCHGAGRAHERGDLLATLLWASLAIVGIVVMSWVAVPQWGGRRLQEVAQRFYREGQAAPEPARSPSLLPAFWLASGLVVLVGLGLAGVLSPRFHQPFSAPFVVPFVVSIRRAQSPSPNWLDLWSGLYLLHALLILLGVPIVFGPPLESLNLIVPVFGYGALTALGGHFYSRYALRRLRDACEEDVG